MLETAESRSTRSRALLIIGAVAALLILLEIIGLISNVTTPLEGLELSARDLSFRLRGARPPAEEIVIVAIDDDSFNWTGYQWPWPRAYLAEIVNWLDQAGARVIGMDVILAEASDDLEGDQALADAFANANATVSVMQVYKDPDTGKETLTLPRPMYTETLHGYGITEVVRDDDAIVRGLRAYKIYNEEAYYNWAFDLARLYLGVEAPSNPDPGSLTFNGDTIPLNQQGLLLVNYAGPASTYPTYTAAFVVLGDYDAELFRDKIVLIGATTETLQDIYPTPYSASALTPGVEIVANAVATLLSGRYMRLAPPWAALALTVLAAVGAWFISRNPRPITALLWVAGVIVAYFAVKVLTFIFTGWEIPLTTPSLMLFLGVVLPTLEQAVTQEIEKRRVRGLFSRFISPEMVNQLLTTQDINSLNKRAELTILFSDIRGFTTLSEKLSPEEVVAMLNPYLEVMTEIIHKYGGTVDKYEGDAILAFFGEPIPHADHAIRATSTAYEMMQALETLNRKWKREGRFNEQFDIGIGLNTGEAFVGLLGSEQRVNYTIIGDNVNLAARLQDQTKEFNWPILLSGPTYEQVKEEFDCEFAESVVLKGKTEPVMIYKLVGRKDKAEGLTL